MAGIRNVSDSKGVGVVAVVAVLAVTGLFITFGILVQNAADKKSQQTRGTVSESVNNVLDSDKGSSTQSQLESSSDSSLYGMAQVRGYAVVRSEKDPENICGETCKVRNNVYFIVSDNDGTNVKQTSIKLGCLDDGIIKLIGPSADGARLQSYEFPADTTSRLLDTNAQKTLLLNVNHIEFTGPGTEAPACYTAHVASV